MPALTQQMAQQYYNSLPPAEKARVDAAGGPSVAWLTNAVNAGVPGAVQAAGGRRQEDIEGGWEQGGGYTLDWQDAAEPSEWMGKRPPTPAELRKWANQTGQSEDYNRYSDRQVAAWIRDSWDVSKNAFRTGSGGYGEKPTEYHGAPGGDPRGGGGFRSGGGGGFRSGGGGYRGGGGGRYGGAPQFDFTAPSYEEAAADPGYQFALREGLGAMERSAAARGTLRTSGTLKDLMDYGRGAATQHYGDVYGRQYQLARDKFAPQYGAWQTHYGGNLSKYLQKQGHIYGALNTPPPAYYGGGY